MSDERRVSMFLAPIASLAETCAGSILAGSQPSGDLVGPPIKVCSLRRSSTRAEGKRRLGLLAGLAAFALPAEAISSSLQQGRGHGGLGCSRGRCGRPPSLRVVWTAQ